jgi:hypothetical protein
MFRQFSAKPNRFKVICQRCGKTGEVDLEKVRNNDFSDGFYSFNEATNIGKVEWFLCSDCYGEIYLEHDEL